MLNLVSRARADDADNVGARVDWAFDEFGSPSVPDSMKVGEEHGVQANECREDVRCDILESIYLR